MEAVSLLAQTFDVLLALAILWTAWRALASPDLFKATVLFVTFGLLMALAWVRLNAPDVALAEAAIGAGLTGALLLNALAHLPGAERGDAALPARGSMRARLLVFALVVLVFAGLAHALLSLPSVAAGLSAQVAAELEASGVRNPVTAVLLNFRGYDTLLEVIVLLAALLGVWSLGDAGARRDAAPGPVLDALARLLTPVLLLVAAYLLWAGAHAPGGAFQAGSVLGAAGVLLLLAGWRLRAELARLPLRIALTLGPGAFVVVAALTLLAYPHMLTYPPRHAAALILLLETLATVSIGATLAALFLGAQPVDERRE